jgi:hypothetical protein
MPPFRSAGSAQHYLAMYAAVDNMFGAQRHTATAAKDNPDERSSRALEYIAMYLRVFQRSSITRTSARSYPRIRNLIGRGFFWLSPHMAHYRSVGFLSVVASNNYAVTQK